MASQPGFGQMKRLDHILGATLRGIAISCLAALFLLLLINVVARGFQLAGFAWFDEIVQGLFAWMVFFGAAALWREHEHFRVEWLEVSLGRSRPGLALQVGLALLCIAFLVTMTWYGWDLTTRSRALTPILRLPTWLFYVAIPVSGAVMTVYSVRDLVRALRQFSTKDPRGVTE